MKKKLLIAVLLLGALLGGCGNDADTVAEGRYHGSADSGNEMRAGTEDEEMSDAEDIDSAKASSRVPAETKGIIAMALRGTLRNSKIQVIAIDPDTGIQNVISEFRLKFDMNEPYFWLDAEYCIMRERFSDDYTKMMVTTHFVETGEEHAGWIDTDGNFFDVTEASGMETKQDFFNTALTTQRAIGFRDGKFAFIDRNTDEVYYVPVDDVSNGTIATADENDVFVRLIKQPIPDRMHMYRLSYRIDSHTYIGDFQEYGFSAICDIDAAMDDASMDAEKVKAYIPEVENRMNWSGVLNPGGDTAAFFSGRIGGAVELYTMSMSDKKPTAIVIEPNDSVIVDWSAMRTSFTWDGPAMCGTGGMFPDDDDGQECCLLEWK